MERISNEMASAPAAAPDSPIAPPPKTVKSQAGPASGIKIQNEPMMVKHKSGRLTCFKIDLAYVFGTHLVVMGWSSDNVEIALQRQGMPVDSKRIAIARADVADALGSSADTAGFVIISKISGAILPSILIDDGQGRYGFNLTADSEQRLRECAPVIQPVLKQLSDQFVPFSPEWEQLISAFPIQEGRTAEAAGHIEAASVSPGTGGGAAVGWVAQAPGVLTWLRNTRNGLHRVDTGFRLFRNDVYDSIATATGLDCSQSGFVAPLSNFAPGDTLQLLALTSTGIHLISSRGTENLGNSPLDAARWLFGINTPTRLLGERFEKVDIHIMEPLLNRKSLTDASLHVAPLQLGERPARPQASIIVPLYGRWDFVEHQLMEFTRDPWLKANVQIIYVIDDPRLKEPLLGAAHHLNALYGVPFLVVPGEVNRGFSAANNLGAKYAEGEVLIFLNSDVFPMSPGWVQQLVAPLKKKPSIGAVGCKLLYGDGSIQHAGIDFKRREDLGIWINHHPLMGLDGKLDDDSGLQDRPAVTGACVAMRRLDFDKIGGWDTGYLIGDFEDTDLCFKLRGIGRKIAYLPDLALTHLERQSLRLHGGDEFRQRVVIYNAARHQHRWRQQLEQTHSS